MRTFCLAILMLTACETPATTDGGTDVAPPDAQSADAPSAVRVPLSLVVLRFDGGDITLPAQGAVVALDQPSVARREETAGPDGRVTFDMLDWSLGPVDVTVFLVGHIAESRIGYLEADLREDVVDTRAAIRLSRLNDDTGIAVTGTVHGLADEAHPIFVSSTAPRSGWFDGFGPGFTAYTSPRISFGLVAVEYEYVELSPGRVRQTIYGWAASPMHTPTGVDETIDLDFAAEALTPETVTGGFTLPDGAFFRSDTAIVRVAERDSSGTTLVGTQTVLDVADTGEVSYTLESTTPPGGAPVLTAFLVYDTSLESQCYIEGRALTGTRTVPLPVPPTFASVGTIDPAAPLEFADVTSDARTGVYVSGSAGLAWRVLGANGATSLHLPAAPTGTPSGALVPPSARVQPFVCGDRDARVELCRRYATGFDRPVSL